MVLQLEDTTPSIGKYIKNHKGLVLGKLEAVEVYQDREIPEFLVLRCTRLKGSDDRYFAIPAQPPWATVGAQGTLMIRIDKEILQIVLGIPAREYDKLDRPITDTVFELYEYEKSKSKM